MTRMTQLFACTLLLGCAAASGQTGASDTQQDIAGSYLIAYDSSMRQTDGGALEVLSRDSALIDITTDGDRVIATWTPRAAGGAKARRLEGTRRGNVVELRGSANVHTSVHRECTVVDDVEECSSTERKVSTIPVYTLTVSGDRITGTIASLDESGSALGPPGKLDGHKTR